MRIIVTGIDTNIGKTVVSAILSQALCADYWKPIQTGIVHEDDTKTIKTLSPKTYIHSCIYSLKHPSSPHYAAALENIQIDIKKLQLPKTTTSLIIETAGGVLVPLTLNCLQIDVYSQWNYYWIIVSKQYLGSINHTLLTIEALKKRNQKILGIIFNGDQHIQNEAAILANSNLPYIARIENEPFISEKIIKKYSDLWKDPLKQLLIQLL